MHTCITLDHRSTHSTPLSLPSSARCTFSRTPLCTVYKLLLWCVVPLKYSLDTHGRQSVTTSLHVDTVRVALRTQRKVSLIAEGNAAGTRAGSKTHATMPTNTVVGQDMRVHYYRGRTRECPHGEGVTSYYPTGCAADKLQATAAVVSSTPCIHALFCKLGYKHHADMAPSCALGDSCCSTYTSRRHCPPAGESRNIAPLYITHTSLLARSFFRVERLLSAVLLPI